MAEGLRVNIWYNVFGWRNSGLLYGNRLPKPAHTSFRFARNELRDATFLGEINTTDIDNILGVKGYKFDRGNRHIWVLWSLDGAQHPISLLPGTPMAVWDVFGNPETPNKTMTIGLMPLYLEWSP